MTWKWLLALAFMDQLPWEKIYAVLGFWGTATFYLVVVWGEILLYAYIISKIIDKNSKTKRRGNKKEPLGRQSE